MCNFVLLTGSVEPPQTIEWTDQLKVTNYGTFRNKRTGLIFTFSAGAIYPLHRQLKTHTEELENDICRVTDPAFYARQFAKIYDIGSTVAPPFAASASSIYLALAYAYRNCPSLASAKSNDTSNKYVLAAALTIGIVPFTLVVIQPTNNDLFALQRPIFKGNARFYDKTNKETRALLKTWVKLNLVRSVFPLLGTAVAWSATLF